MIPRRRRLLLVGLVLAGVTLAAAFALRAFQENLLYFYSPSQAVAGEPPADRVFRLGGMVLDGSVEREPGSLEVRFVLTDFRQQIPVRYTGVLPDLFREGQGIVTRGRLAPDGEFMADEVFAKHDENYMPPEVAQSIGREPGAGD